MKTNISNGLNVAEINWNYCLVLHRHDIKNHSKWEKEMQKVMTDCSFNQMYWAIERSKCSEFTHLHLLLDTENLYDLLALTDYFKRFVCKGREVSCESKYTKSSDSVRSNKSDKKIFYDLKLKQNMREIEFVEPRTLVSPDSNEKIEQMVLRKQYIPFVEIKGNKGRCYIEEVKALTNAALYTNKLATGKRISTGYLNSNWNKSY
jgi:hypothetical protein